MSEMHFEPFPKIPRLKRGCIITEKLDGTNAQVAFNEEGDMLCGSRKRIITPEDDNYGFARWAYSHKESLFGVLGKGRHFGEWWGQGIQRRYDQNSKKFSLFNTERWLTDDITKLHAVEGLDCVPVLYNGEFNSNTIDEIMESLRVKGSVASPGYNNPEGIVIFHSASRSMFKRTFEYDEKGKS